MKFTRIRITKKAYKQALKGRYKKRAPVKVQRTLAVLGDGLPKRMMLRQHYIQNYNITSTSGVPAVYKWATNGLFDPDVSGGGHQPYYFDQMAALYNHYTVIGSKITIIVSPDTTATDSFVAGVYINDDTTTTPISLNEFMETTKSKFKVANQAQGSPLVFSSKWSAKKTFGGSVLANSALRGTTSSNPSETSVYNFFLSAMDSASTVAVSFIARVDYIVQWSELKDIAGS